MLLCCLNPIREGALKAMAREWGKGIYCNQKTGVGTWSSTQNLHSTNLPLPDTRKSKSYVFILDYVLIRNNDIIVTKVKILGGLFSKTAIGIFQIFCMIIEDNRTHRLSQMDILKFF